jgi:hypothetical protein
MLIEGILYSLDRSSSESSISELADWDDIETEGMIYSSSLLDTTSLEEMLPTLGLLCNGPSLLSESEE